MNEATEKVLRGITELCEGPGTFTFEVAIRGVGELTDDIANRLHEAGCDDGTPFFQEGELRVLFTRYGVTRSAAIRSAIEQIKAANIPGMQGTSSRYY